VQFSKLTKKELTKLIEESGTLKESLQFNRYYVGLGFIWGFNYLLDLYEESLKENKSLVVLLKEKMKAL